MRISIVKFKCKATRISMTESTQCCAYAAAISAPFSGVRLYTTKSRPVRQY
jgi:hypothetical protein